MRRNKPELLLVNPGGRLSIYQSLASEFAAIEPPVWAGLIATYARRAGIEVDILDANALDLCAEEVAAEVEKRSPLLTAIVVYGHNPSASTQVMPSARAICAAIRNRAPEQKIALVGGHVASLPERTMEEEPCDFICDGEGPVTLTELTRALASGAPVEGVLGLLYRDGVTVRRTPPAPLVIDLDHEMPGIAWDLLPMERYRAHNWHCFDGMNRQPYAAIYTSLGCPCRCSFCCIQAPFRTGEKALGKKTNSYRLWSVESVLGEIDILVGKYGMRNIKFADELFVLDADHVNGICDGIIERGYDLNIWAYARVDTLRDSMLERFRKAGITWLALGIEAASDRVRDDASKGFAREKIFDAVGKIRSAGINVGANYIFGLPEDDLETMQETLDLALSLNTEWANFNCAMAYPGSELYLEALRKGVRLPNDWSGYSQYSYNSLPLATKHVSAAEVIRFRDNAFHTYFSNPEYLELVRRKFGEEACRHVIGMTQHRLKRKYA